MPISSREETIELLFDLLRQGKAAILLDGLDEIPQADDDRRRAQVHALVNALVDEFPYHGSITSSIELADHAGTEKLALVHLDRNFREQNRQQIHDIVQGRPGTLLPVAGDHIRI
ncbi:MAG: hypothetical protein DSY58_06415 [Desulfobulbus sp.]|nr:MAG: hypothetical protein DSY58_06415 [Desulfobulbus sp.]